MVSDGVNSSNARAIDYGRAAIAARGASTGARALIQANLRSDLAALIQEIYAEPPWDDITDTEIRSEVNAVRQRSMICGLMTSYDR